MAGFCSAVDSRIDDLLPWAYITAPELKAVA